METQFPRSDHSQQLVDWFNLVGQPGRAADSAQRLGGIKARHLLPNSKTSIGQPNEQPGPWTYKAQKLMLLSCPQDKATKAQPSKNLQPMFNIVCLQRILVCNWAHVNQVIQQMTDVFLKFQSLSSLQDMAWLTCVGMSCLLSVANMITRWLLNHWIMNDEFWIVSFKSLAFAVSNPNCLDNKALIGVPKSEPGVLTW